MYGYDKKYIPKRPGEAQITLADISESRQKIGYDPSEDIKDYIQNWLKNIE